MSSRPSPSSRRNTSTSESSFRHISPSPQLLSRPSYTQRASSGAFPTPPVSTPRGVPPAARRPSYGQRTPSEVRRGDFIYSTCQSCAGQGNQQTACQGCQGRSSRSCVGCKGAGTLKSQCAACDGRGKTIRAATLDAQRKKERQLTEEERRDEESREWGRRNLGVRA